MGSAELGQGVEFDLIRVLVSQWGTQARGIGDDAALLEVPPGHTLVASVDSAVDGVHFRRAWLTPREIGYRAAAAALSDLAAMAATPTAILIAFAIPPEWLADIGEVADGIGEMARVADAVIAGGNVTKAPLFSVTTTVLGSVVRALPRAGAMPGDRVYVTGRLGGPAAALRALGKEAVPDDAHRARFAHPEPRLREARWLAAHGAASAVDISDGLLADLGHIAAASGLRLSIDLGSLPLVSGTSAIDAAASGEEYEIAVTSRTPLNVRAFEAEFGIPLTEIGVAASGRAGVEATLEGRRVAPIAGHDHLSG